MNKLNLNLSISAIIVTFNRKKSLEKCLESLFYQTLPASHVILIDNASTDGTEEMVKNRFKQVSYFRLSENIGGAGGFHEGIKIAVKMGFSWFWLIDDDSVLDKKALENLVLSSNLDKNNVYGSITVSNEEPNKIVFGIIAKENDKKKYIKYYCEIPKIPLIETVGIGFCGFFISRSVVEKVGLPMKELFIYADDSEYSRRINLKYKIKMFYVRESIIYHPDIKLRQINFLWKKISIIDSPPWKCYYNIRNHLYLLKQYNNWLKFYFFIIPKQFFFLIIRLLFLDKDQKLKRFYFYFFGIFDSLLNRFGKRF